MNGVDTRTKFFILILVFTIGVLVRFLNDIKIEDEPVRTFTTSISLGTNYSNMGTASMQSTTTTTL